MPSPKLVPIELTDDERRTLGAWARRRKTAQALAQRSRIVLRCAEGGTIGEAAAELGVSRDMVSKWRSRFARDRLEGLTDEPRPGRPRTISDEQVEAVITATLEQAPPDGDSHWSTRSMARSAGMSQSAVSRIWRTFGLKPHMVQAWKLSTDPQFINKVRDGAGQCPGLVRGREATAPGAGPHGPVPADAAHYAGADDARLRRQRHPAVEFQAGAASRSAFREACDAPADGRVLLGMEVLIAAPEDRLCEPEPDPALSTGLRDQPEERVEVEIHPEDREP